MHQTATLDVCPDKLVNGILRGMRRRGLPANVDADDLRQEGLIAVWRSGHSGPSRLLAKIERNAMFKHLNAKGKERRGSVQLVTDASGEYVPPKAPRDPFASLPVDDGKAYRSGKARRAEPTVRTLASRHAEWEQGRAEGWV
jgi:DNA-directed RNA polymerase specialized sigma24 family protein